MAAKRITRLRFTPGVSGSTLTNDVHLLTQTAPSGNWSIRT